MTKDELKALIATITKENTTEQVHADVLNAIVDAMPEGGGDTILVEFPNKIFYINNQNSIITTSEEIYPICIKLFGYDPNEDTDLDKFQNAVSKLNGKIICTTPIAVNIEGNTYKLTNGIFVCNYSIDDDRLTARFYFKDIDRERDLYLIVVDY